MINPTKAAHVHNCISKDTYCIHDYIKHQNKECIGDNINSAICVLCREVVVFSEVQNVLKLISRTCNTSSKTLNMAPEKATVKRNEYSALHIDSLD